MTNQNPPTVQHPPVQSFATLTQLDLHAAQLELEWVVTIDTPTAGVDQVTSALGAALTLVQGNYDNCLFVRENGYQQFRALEGSHAGAEGTIQRTPASQIEFSIAPDTSLLHRVFEVVFAAHVNEEPTVRITEAVGSRSKLLDDTDNPNRYWNRSDAEELHGTPID